VQNAYNNPNSVANRLFNTFYKNFSQKTKDRLGFMGNDFVNSWAGTPTGMAIPAVAAGAGQLGETHGSTAFDLANDSLGF
jgi:hypothetical protein